MAAPPSTTVREYVPELTLKYGVNPHQKPAQIYSIKGSKLPFKVLNGNPGYINLLDAINSWQLVHELRQALNLPAAASFKHVSPAGAAVAVPLSDLEKQIYGVDGMELTPTAVAYIRARGADPKCSFGDFAAVSDRVDEATALIMKREVSDGIIAPGFDDKALEILKTKQDGRYIILQADPDYVPPPIEYREIYGVGFSQRRNDTAITRDHFKNIVTANKDLPEAALRDLIVATICIKYTQSNSVGYALNGQMIGVGAGQQSRVDCVKLAGSKLEIWYLRQHPKVQALKFKPNLKGVERTNARIRYIEGGFTEPERVQWEAYLTEVPSPLTHEEKEAFLHTLKGVSLSSDAFFPFRDNIDQASKRGVQYIAEPGGSVQDQAVVEAANQYGMTMCFTELRLFHH